MAVNLRTQYSGASEPDAPQAQASRAPVSPQTSLETSPQTPQDAPIIVREYTDDDLDALRAMHAAQNFGYPFPDLRDPLFLVRAVVEDHGRPRMAALLRLTAEAYLLADPREGTPRQRWRWLLALHEATRAAAAARGLADVQAFLPPQVARPFGRRLAKLGWRQDPWTCYTHQL